MAGGIFSSSDYVPKYVELLLLILTAGLITPLPISTYLHNFLFQIHIFINLLHIDFLNTAA